MTTFYIADPHFGHANIIKLCDRPFADVKEMNRVLADSWNARVGDADDVYVVGDFAYRSAEDAGAILRSLRGRKHLVIGNHDAKGLKGVDLAAHFHTVDHAAFITDERGRRVWMCHYPCMTWPKHAYHVYGHIHGNRPEPFWPLLRGYERALNAGVEVNGYMPVTLDELIANNARWRREA